jgi:predicted membrane channel-forming protein YqfA (hemolysin III family)
LLVPGGIFLVTGLVFEFETLTHWHYAEYTWPLYLLAVAFGLFQLYLFSNRPRPLLIPVFILSGVTILAYLTMIYGALSSIVNFGLVIPLFLILIGLVIMFRK